MAREDSRCFIEMYSDKSESVSNIGPFDDTDKAEAWIDSILKDNLGCQFTIHFINEPNISEFIGDRIVDESYNYPDW